MLHGFGLRLHQSSAQCRNLLRNHSQRRETIDNCNEARAIRVDIYVKFALQSLEHPCPSPAATLRSELAITHTAVQPLLPELGGHCLDVLAGRESPTALVDIAEAKGQPALLTIVLHSSVTAHPAGQLARAYTQRGCVNAGSYKRACSAP